MKRQGSGPSISFNAAPLVFVFCIGFLHEIFFNKDSTIKGLEKCSLLYSDLQ